MSTLPGSKGRIFGLLVDRPVLTLMVSLAIVSVGAMALWNLPLRLVPAGMVSSRINVWVPIAQAQTPREVEEKVVKPTEELLRTIPGLREIRSNSHTRGARFWINLDEDLEPTLASAEVRDRLQRARQSWPEGVDRYFTWREDASEVPLAFFQMLTPERNPDWDHRIEKIVQPRLEAVEGVGRVEIWGHLEESIRIWFDREKLIAHRVDYRELITRLASDNFTEPVGELKSQDERLLLRVDSKFRSLQEIERYPVRTGLLLRDIARIERVPSVSNSLSRFNQRFCYSGAIRATAGTNPVATCKRVRETAAAMAAEQELLGLDFRFMLDQGAMIEGSLKTLLKSLAQGGALALLVLFLFMRHVRATLAIAIAIPFTMLIVCGWLFFTGDTLNILTMAGMTLAVGMVVDNSVVVMENIRRLREEGVPLRQACVDGAREVGLAVTVATLTTVVVFLPMVFMSSRTETRVMFGSVGVPLSIALLGSLFVALLLLPSVVRNLSRHAHKQVAGSPVWSPAAWLVGFNRLLLRFCLRRRYWMLLVLVVYAVLMGANVIPAPFPSLDLETRGGGPFRRGDITVNLEMPRGMTLRDVVTQVRSYEQFILARKKEWQVKSVSARLSRTFARIDIQIPSDVRMSEVPELANKVRKAWPRRPGVKMVLHNVGGEADSTASEKNQRNFVVRLRGRDSEHLMELGVKIQERLLTLAEVEELEIAMAEDNKEVVMELDPDRMQELGVRPEVLFGTVTAGLQGREISRFEEKGRELRLIAEFDSEHNPTLKDLKDTRVWSSRQSSQSIDEMARIRFRKALGTIFRRDGKTTVTLVGRRTPGTGPRAFSKILSSNMRRFKMPAGYSWEEDSASRETERQMDELRDAGTLSVILIFLLMAVLFESIILPGAILVTIVIASVGAMWSLKFFYGAIDPMAITGLILLSGVVVNNGIVLLDCIQRFRHGGLNREEAIFAGIRVRLRPIFMTAATTIVGLMPMALFGEETGGGISYVSMSITVAGGLFLCTIFTAPAVALIYTYLDDLSDWQMGIWARTRSVLSRGPAAPSAS